MMLSPRRGMQSNRLPPLIKGCRYAHELMNPTPIDESIRSVVLELLRNYYIAVSDNAPTLSESSRTSVPAHSEASEGTSITDMTIAFSVSNGSVQKETKRTPLVPAQRARKALMRKLQACQQDCRARKVKCPLYHHALRDLLEITDRPDDEVIVEWAIQFDAGPHSPVTTASASTRVAAFAAGGMMEARDEVVDQATSVFDLPPGAPMLYESSIQETTAALLGGTDGILATPFTPQANFVQAPLTSPYSTSKNSRMFAFGTRADSLSPKQYFCEFPECRELLPLQDLSVHFENIHLRFKHLSDPLRMVCPACFTFYADPGAQCPLHPYPPVVEKAWGEYYPDVPAVDDVVGNGSVPSGPSSLSFLDPQGYGAFCYHGSGSLLPSGTGNLYTTYRTGSRTNRDGGYSLTLNEAMIYAKQAIRYYISRLHTIHRLFPTLVRNRWYNTALVIAVGVSIIFGLNKHDWVISTLARLADGLPAAFHMNFAVFGVVLASLAFGLHRLAVHAHRLSGRHRSRWYLRCAVGISNVACGLRVTELTRYERHELGHSRS